VAPSDWAPLLLEKPDLMKGNGKSYVFEPMRFQGTPAVITAMANNELELGNLAFSSLALAIQNAGLEDLRIVGDQFKDGVQGHFSNQYYVLKDSPATLPCARCCASPASRTSATTPWSRLRSPP
jgi:NitT/TauT family transport system substrate-binding protein